MAAATLNKKCVGHFLNLAPIICSIMVIGLHSYNAGNLPADCLTARIQGFFSHGVFMLAVPVFMFMSAFLFFRNVETIHQVFEKQKKRISTVVLPFFAWSAAYYLFYAVSNHLLGVSMSHPVDISPIGILRGIVFYEYCFPLWYLFILVVFTALTPAIFYLLRSNVATLLSIAVLFVLSSFGLADIEISVFGLDRTLFMGNFFAYYLFGCWCAKQDRFEKIAAGVEKIPAWILGLAFVVVCTLESLFYDGVIPVFYSRLLVPCVFVFGVALLLKAADKWPISRVTCVSTMVVYGAHSLVGQFVGTGITAILHPNALTAYFLNFAITVLLSFALSFLMKKWLKPLDKIFGGFR